MTRIQKRLCQLKKEHQELDLMIHDLSANPYTDQLRLRRMKLRKLRLKDEIKMLQDQLIPDMDA